MTIFHPFCRLPKELRLFIWELTVEPRIVDVRSRFIERPDAELRILCSSTPVPVQLQICQESRNAGLYKPSFSDIDVLKGKKKESDQRYIWLNLDTDMIFIHSHLVGLRSVAHSIKRLRFVARDCYDQWYYFSEGGVLRHFINVLEIHVVLDEQGGFLNWLRASEDYEWPCGPENVFLIDSEGEKMKLTDFLA